MVAADALDHRVAVGMQGAGHGQIGDQQVEALFRQQLEEFVHGACLRNHLPHGVNVDDGPHTEPHDGVIVGEEDPLQHARRGPEDERVLA